jgi:hypothetical protein
MHFTLLKIKYSFSEATCSSMKMTTLKLKYLEFKTHPNF